MGDRGGIGHRGVRDASVNIHLRLARLREGWGSPAVPARSGMGKTSCALWMARNTKFLGRRWMFVSLPAVEDPFAPMSLVTHLERTFGLNETEREELKQCPLVLILDSLDEVPRRHAPKQSWWALNDFDAWNVKLIVTCREENINHYGNCMGKRRAELYIQGFAEYRTEKYLRLRLRQRETALASGAAVAGSQRRAAPGAPAASPADPLEPLAEDDMKEMMRQIRGSPIRASYAIPFSLSMGADLFIGVKGTPRATDLSFGDIKRLSQLYDMWLRHWIESQRAEEVGPGPCARSTGFFFWFMINATAPHFFRPIGDVNLTGHACSLWRLLDYRLTGC